MTIVDELMAFNRSYSDALAAQDFDRVGGMYTEDAVLVTSGQPLLRGREAITATLRQQAGPEPVSISFESDTVWESGELVVDVGSWLVGGEEEERGKYVVVLRRQDDGSLKLLVDAPGN
jgi:ketosteroid isomerase-like protein